MQPPHQRPWRSPPGAVACAFQQAPPPSPVLTLSPLLRSFQKGWMKSQEPSLPVASSVTLMAFFSSRAGSRLFTVRYLLLFMCRSCEAAGGQVVVGGVRSPQEASPSERGALGGTLDPGTHRPRQTWPHAQSHTQSSTPVITQRASAVLNTLRVLARGTLQQPEGSTITGLIV